MRDGKTFRWEGVYSKDMNTRETLRTELNVFEEFRPRLHDRLRYSRQRDGSWVIERLAP